MERSHYIAIYKLYILKDPSKTWGPVALRAQVLPEPDEDNPESYFYERMAIAHMAMGSDSEDGEHAVMDPYGCSTPPHKTGHHARSPLGVTHASQHADVDAT